MATAHFSVQPISFSQWIKQRRRSLDLTQAELADRLGCSLSTLQKFEEGRRRPSKQMAELLAIQLQILEAQKAAFLQAARTLDGVITQVKTESVRHSPTPLPPSRHNLPALLTPLVGRTEEIAAISTLLDNPAIRLVTLTGSGGVGKTRLSLALAWQLLEAAPSTFTDGIWFVPLATLNDPRSLHAALIKSLNLHNSAAPTELDQLVAALRNKRALLVLDNFEQIVEAATALSELLVRCPTLKLLVTSRVVLNVRGEHEFSLAPLPVPSLTALPPITELAEWPSVKLFVQRAQAVNHTLRLDPENAATVAALCAQLDGLPLAIELAAVRCRLFSPAALLDELRHSDRPRLNLLTRNLRDVDPRHHSLRTAIAWSVDRLSPAERQAFACLSILPPDSPLAAALAVSGSDFATLAALREQSLIQFVQTAETTRIFTLETLREYGSELLLEAPTSVRVDAYQRLLAWCSELCGPIGLKLAQFISDAEATAFQREQHILTVALQWCLRHDQASGLRLACAASHRWYRYAYYRVGRDWLRSFIDSPGDDDEVRAAALHNLGLLEERCGEFRNSLPYFQKARQIYDNLGMSFESAHTDVRMADVYFGNIGDKEQAEKLCLAALPAFEIENDDTALAWIYSVLASACEKRKPDSEVEYWMDRCYAHALHSRDAHAQTWMFAIAGEYDLRFGKAARASERLYRSLAQAKANGYWSASFYAALRLTSVCWALAEYAASYAAMAEALAVADHGYVPGYLCQLTALIVLWFLPGHSDRQRLALLGQALSLSPRLRERIPTADRHELQQWLEQCEQNLGQAEVQALLQPGKSTTYEELLAAVRAML